ncbi:MAG: hypothetical protein H6587_08465 [Flavobacteriales bacterium]|nr:hypothetical protein [Flavobacteriales bacterium]MCB9364587.1 hypothetical protein [Flavobacteriales bacterium]
MKKLLLSLLTLITISTLKAQQEEDAQITCYQKYAEVFEKRGAEDVEDGTYDNVIITFRKGSMADCFMGKVTVRGGAIDPNEMYLKFIDDEYEKVVRKYRYPDQVVKIINGMSRTMVTSDDELIDVLFTKKIKPKKKSYVRAADPDFDF